MHSEVEHKEIRPTLSSNRSTAKKKKKRKKKKKKKKKSDQQEKVQGRNLFNTMARVS
jgi:hypothetical protein